MSTTLSQSLRRHWDEYLIEASAPGMLWQHFWIYLTAPVLGTLVGAQPFLAVRGARRTGCAKLLHPAEARCIHCGYEPVHRASDEVAARA